jgi:hypothetical protein
MKRILVPFMLIWFVHNALAQTTVWPMPTGLLLQNGKSFYGAMVNANWKISQWSSPGALSGFGNDGIAANQYAYASFENGTITLAQDGQHQPCLDAHGGPNEFDLFASPNVLPASTPTLDGMAGMTINGKLTAEAIDTSAKVCAVNTSTVMVAVILRNASGQIMYYQLHFPLSGARQVAGHWNSSHTIFDDYALTSYGLSPLMPYRSVTFSFDVLPKIKAALANVSLADWRLVSWYAGQSVWGEPWARSDWTGLNFTVK